MPTLPIPERAMVRRTHNPPLYAEQELLLAIRAPQTPIQGRWLLEVVKLLLDRLPPAQPPLPGILPQFNPGPPLQSFLSSPALPGIIPQRRITPVEERYSRTSSTQESFDWRAPKFDPIRERYNRRLADLKTLLSPLTRENDSTGDDHKYDDSGCVLLCWGSSSSCRALAVNHIGRPIDQELFWKKLQTAWYNTRGRWRQKMPWYGIRRVKQVEIRLVGSDSKDRDLFHGVYQPVDKALETEKDKLWESMSTTTLPDYRESEYEEEFTDPELYPCRYDPKEGSTVHGMMNCDGLSFTSEGYVGFDSCSVEEFYKNSERLTRLKMEPLRTLLFQNPKMAIYNELENAELVHSSRSIRNQYQGEHCASLGQLVFRGLHIEDGWTFDATIPAIFMPLAAVVSILIVLLARLTYSDWGVAWNVGACFIPLLTGLGSWLLHVGTSR